MLLTLVLLCATDYSGLISNVAAMEVQKNNEVEVHTLKNDEKIILEEPKVSNVLTRLPGPMWYGPHPRCMMCLGNHLMSVHGQSYTYLQKIGRNQYQTLHDNIHNAKKPEATVKAPQATVKKSSPCANGQCGRRGLFGRFR